MSYYVIGDIAGQYKTLLALVEKLPKDANIISVGDLPDRGPDSKEVIQWFIDNEDRAQCLLANHEHMMLDEVTNDCLHYGRGCWTGNGGHATINSYGNNFPPEHLAFLASRKDRIELEIDGKKFWISHAFPNEQWLESITEGYDEPKFFSQEMEDRLWNRGYPERHTRYDIAICGHNSHFGYRTWSDDKGPIGICIDTSRSSILTALELSTLKIIQQEYI